jgi:hypothetical protein
MELGVTISDHQNPSHATFCDRLVLTAVLTECPEFDCHKLAATQRHTFRSTHPLISQSTCSISRTIHLEYCRNCLRPGVEHTWNRCQHSRCERAATRRREAQAKSVGSNTPPTTCWSPRSPRPPTGQRTAPTWWRAELVQCVYGSDRGREVGHCRDSQLRGVGFRRLARASPRWTVPGWSM